MLGVPLARYAVNAVLFVAGEFEGQLRARGGIPATAQRMAEAIAKRGVPATDVQLIKGEDHGSVKPSVDEKSISTNMVRASLDPIGTGFVTAITILTFLLLA